MNPLKVLLIEDQGDDAKLIRRILTNNFNLVEIDHIDDLDVFKQKIQSDNYDIILTDYNCGNFSGIDVITELETLNRDIPVVVITGEHRMDIAVEAMKYHVDDYILKDFRCFKQLPEIIKRVIDNHNVISAIKNSEKNISESLGNYINLCVKSPELIVSIWNDGSFISINTNLQNMLGYSRKKINSMNFRDILAEEFHIEFDYVIKNLDQNKPKKDVEFAFVNNEGDKIYVKGKASTRIENGKIIGSHWVLHNISEFKNLDNRLIQSNQQYKVVFENASVPMVMGDHRGIVLQINQAACALIGYSREEMLGRHIRSITHPLDIIMSLINHRKLTRGLIDNYTLVKRYKHKDGHYIKVEVTAVLIRNKAGQPWFAIAEFKKLEPES